MSSVLIAVLLAGTAEEKQEGHARLVEAATALAASCGPIAVSYDWSSETAALPGKPASQGPLFCKDAVAGFARTCGLDDITRAGLGTNVKAIKCLFEDGAARKSGHWGPQFAFSDGTLTVTYDWNSTNIESDAAEWTLKQLPLPGPVGPEPVEAKQERPRGVADLQDAAADLFDKCGVKIAVVYDLDSEKVSPAKPALRGYALCTNVVEGLGTACEQDQAKPKVMRKVKTLRCHFQAGASEKQPGGAVLQLKKTTLDAAFDWKTLNLADETRKWVGKKL
jgi:hypothetical protein